MNMKTQILLIIIIAAVALIAGCTQAQKQSEVTDITPEQLNEMMQNKDFILIDVHIPEQEHIKGTDDVLPFNELTQRMDELPVDLSAKMVVYCRSGSMSKTASKELADMGYTNVYNLVGGRNDWVAKGFDN